MSKNNSSFGINNILKIISNADAHVHFLGVGGSGMAPLFRLSSHFGISVSGSDAAHGAGLDGLLRDGGCVWCSADAAPAVPEHTSLLVYSLAVDERDAELLDAESRAIPTVSRAEYLAALATCFENTVAVCGSHGKSTVTAMLSRIFDVAGKNPTTLCGASLSKDTGNCRIGALDQLIFESCEYKDSFLIPRPDFAVFLNLELDHVDWFPTLDKLSESFLHAMNRAGRAVVNIDDPQIAKNIGKCYTPPVSFGKNADADYRIIPASDTPHALRFSLSHHGCTLGEISLSMIGTFNIYNAAAATVTALECGIPFEVCARALSDFQGIERRLEYIGEYNSRPVYYDYAHHPTEIAEGIKAVKSDTGGHVTVIFGPHTYSRTKGLWRGFVNSLCMAEYIILTEISAIRESKIEDISAEGLAAECGAAVVGRDGLIQELVDRTDGAIIIMGAADMNGVKKVLICG